MNKQEKKIDIFMSLSFNEEELNALKGGVANVVSSAVEASKEGDGAKYVCCIKIGTLKQQ